MVSTTFSTFLAELLDGSQLLGDRHSISMRGRIGNRGKFYRRLRLRQAGKV